MRRNISHWPYISKSHITLTLYIEIILTLYIDIMLTLYIEPYIYTKRALYIAAYAAPTLYTVSKYWHTYFSDPKYWNFNWSHVRNIIISHWHKVFIVSLALNYMLSPIYIPKEPYVYTKRALRIYQKSPIHRHIFAMI